jgi:hypothetical protein
MSSKQLYVTADLVGRNSLPIYTPQPPQPPQPPNVLNDVFDIPEIISPHLSNIAASALPAVPSLATNTVNFIKSINHTAMTDVMNQFANQKQKTPSITTKHTDTSIQVPNQGQPQIRTSSNGGNLANHVANAAIPVTQGHHSHPHNHHHHPEDSGVLDGSVTGNTTTIKKNIPKNMCKNTLNKKVIVEEEDKDSAIDYDDDDAEIKKIKLSLFQFAKDITFNLIFAIPFLQKARLNAMLKDSSLAINQIERIFDEFKDRFSQFELESIKKYVCEDGIRDQLNFILETGFNKILSDGVIDINDAPQFNQLVYYIIKSFNDINHGKVYRFYVSREHVMLLLHFVLKSVFSLTLKGQEEQMALGLLDTSFKLVQLEVLPIVSKRWYHRFRICQTAKQIEDIIE